MDSSFNKIKVRRNIEKLERVLIDGISTKDKLIIAFLKRDIYPLYKAEIEKIKLLEENKEIQKYYLNSP